MSVRARILLVPAVVLGLGAFLPPVSALEGDPATADPTTTEGAASFPGFAAVDSYAQGQMATGYFFAVGDEENRLVGAQSVINGPPAGSGNIAAFVQRGVAMTYMYGLFGGGGPGKAGVLPQPPPGEAGAFFPADPQEATWQGPVTSGAKGPAVDGRFHAKATPTPTGVADAAVTSIDVPGQFKAEAAVVVSHTEPAEGGVAAESVSVVRGLTVGPLRVESLVSRAYGFISAKPEAPKGTATTVLEGVTINGTPVKVTDKGVVAGDQSAPGAQNEVNAALTQAGLKEVRLTASSATPGDKDESVQAVAGALKIVHRDNDFGSKNPQGFSGGGFSVGGADIKVLGRRCAPACPTAPEVGVGAGTGGDLPPVDQPVPSPGAGAPSSPGASPAPESGGTGTGSGLDGAASASTAAALGSSGSTVAAISSGSYQPPDGASYTSATTPSPPASPAGAATAGDGTGAAAPGVPLASAERARLIAAALGTGPKEATWARDAYLAFTAALIAVLVFGGRYLVGARPPGRR